MTSESLSRQTCERRGVVRVCDPIGRQRLGPVAGRHIVTCVVVSLDSFWRPDKRPTNLGNPDRVAANVEMKDPAATIDRIVPLRPGRAKQEGESGLVSDHDDNIQASTRLKNGKLPPIPCALFPAR